VGFWKPLEPQPTVDEAVRDDPMRAPLVWRREGADG